MVALPVTLGMFAISLSIATSVNQGFAATEARNQARIAEMSSAASRVLADFKLARENCKKFAGGERLMCGREAIRAQRRALAEARLAPRCAAPAICSEERVAARPMYAVDTAMFQSNRPRPTANAATPPLSP